MTSFATETNHTNTAGTTDLCSVTESTSAHLRVSSCKYVSSAKKQNKTKQLTVLKLDSHQVHRNGLGSGVFSGRNLQNCVVHIFTFPQYRNGHDSPWLLSNKSCPSVHKRGCLGVLSTQDTTAEIVFQHTTRAHTDVDAPVQLHMTSE